MKKVIKQAVYKEYVDKLVKSLDEGYYFESAWCSYVIIEDRFVSLLKCSGGHQVNGKDIRMLGPKISEIEARAVANKLLEVYINEDNFLSRIKVWKDSRNNLMHSMVEGAMTVAQIENEIKRLAEEGKALAHKLIAIARRFKKHS